MGWLLIGVLLVVGLFILIKIKKLADAKQHLFFKIMVFLSVLFAVSVIYFWFKSGMSLGSYEGFVAFGKSYFLWLGGIFGNVGDVTSYVVKQDWGVNGTG